MIFDKLARIVEKNFPDKTAAMLNSARLFTLPKRPDGVTLSEESLTKFCLPYPTVIVENDKNCVLIQDRVSGQMGLSVERSFIEIVHLSAADPVMFGDGSSIDVSKTIAKMGEDAYLVCMGCLKDCKIENGVPKVVGELFHVYIFVDDKPVLNIPPESLKQPNFFKLFQNFRAALEQFVYTHKDNNFVLEYMPLKVRHGKKISRTPEKSLFQILTPGEIREKMGISTDVIVCGVHHDEEKRALFEVKNLLQSEDDPRVIMQIKGKTTVKSNWIGQIESVKSAHKYRVALEVGFPA